MRNAPDRNRFEVHVDGELAGFAEYVDSGDQRIFFHTEIGENFGGRGLASTLIKAALTETRSDGKRIVPVCPYVARWVRGHDDFADSVDRVKSVHLEAVRAANAEADGTTP